MSNLEKANKLAAIIDKGDQPMLFVRFFLDAVVIIVLLGLTLVGYLLSYLIIGHSFIFVALGGSLFFGKICKFPLSLSPPPFF